MTLVLNLKGDKCCALPQIFVVCGRILRIFATRVKDSETYFSGKSQEEQHTVTKVTGWCNLFFLVDSSIIDGTPYFCFLKKCMLC